MRYWQHCHAGKTSNKRSLIPIQPLEEVPPIRIQPIFVISQGSDVSYLFEM